MPSSRRPRKIEEFASTLRDPVRFAHAILRANIWSHQADMLRSLATHPRTAVKACHSSGKTYVTALATLWWLTQKKDAIVVTTAPTWTQVERQIWNEIRNAASRSLIKFPQPSATSLELGPGRYAIGVSTNEGVRFQGFHGNVLMVLDEAPGVLPEIWEAIEGIRAGGNVRILALGNPVISSGPFYDAFTSNRESWNLITISAFDTPNLEGITLESLLQMSEEELDANPRPYLITRRWVREKYLEWGPGHPLWESRVLGNFPLQSDDTLLPLSWLEQAKLRTEGEGEMHAGIDVAGPGEAETVLCVRRGPKIELLRAWSNSDPRGDVVAALMPYKAVLKNVNVDSVGVGHYMAKHLQDFGFRVTSVNVGEAPRDRERYANLKSEIYWGFRDRARNGDLAGLTDDKAIAQLAAIRYEHNSRGQIVIESKDDARKRGVKSPDRAEAIILAFAQNELLLGLLEFYRRETERIEVQPKPISIPESCPRCGHKGLAQYGQNWKCNACNASGSGHDNESLKCPICESTAIAKIGGILRCNQCGHQFGDPPTRPRQFSRSDALSLLDRRNR